MNHGQVVYAREITDIIRVEVYEDDTVRVWHHKNGSFNCSFEEAMALFKIEEDK